MSGLIYYNDKRRVLPKLVRSDQFSETIIDNKDFLSGNFFFNDEEIRKLYLLWKKDKNNKSVSGEIVSFAIVAGKELEYADVIEQFKYKNSESKESEDIQIDLHERISNNKKKLIFEPKDSITWTNQAINYLELGQREKALNAIYTALTIEKNSSFVTRNASRIFNIIGDNSLAIKILKSSDYYKYDPQILSSEISFSQLENRQTKGIDLGMNLLLKQKERYQLSQLSELSSTLGTVEYFKGDFKKSEKLFDISLESFNENSFAQSLWYKKNPLPNKLNTFFEQSPEIQTHLRIKESDFINAFNSANDWTIIEPYSKRPFETAAFIGGVLLDKFDVATQLMETSFSKQKQIKGTLSSNDETAFKNNIAYYLLRNNKLDEAKVYLKDSISLVDRQNLNSIEHAYIATLGLYFYKIGEIELARKFYSKTINFFKTQNNLYNTKSAFLNFIREEISITDSKEELIKLKKELDIRVNEKSENDLIYIKNKLIKDFEEKIILSK